MMFQLVGSFLLLVAAFSVEAVRPISRLGASNRLGSLKSVSSSSVNISYETYWFNQTLDHFNLANTQTFQQRYLVNQQWWTKPDSQSNGCGPIFFYTGNEGSIELFANNTGSMFEWAPEFGALIIFAEHRFYGRTFPSSFNASNLADWQWLTAEQALADYAVLLKHLKTNVYNCPNASVIAFGGSYGGMLAAWFRIKYPQVVIGAIAASAPIWQFTGLAPATTYNSIATRTFLNSGPNGQACVDGFTSTWGILQNYSATAAGRHNLTSILGLCPGSLDNQTAAQAFNSVAQWIVGALSYLPMGDYPYPATFLGPMPGNPVSVVCSYFSADRTQPDQILESVRNGMNVYYNWTGEGGSCFNISTTGPADLGDQGWNYQSCTEMVMPLGQYGPPTDMFYYAPWNYTQVAESCQVNWAATPRPNWIIDNFGGYDLATAGVSNIIFTNGNLDPWSGGGVLFNISDTVKSYIIEGGAHHLDLRSSDPLDPPSVTFVRSQQRMWIHKWISGSDDSSSLPRNWLVLISIVGTAVVIIGGYYLIKWYNEWVKPVEYAPTHPPSDEQEYNSPKVPESAHHYHESGFPVPSGVTSANSDYVRLQDNADAKTH